MNITSARVWELISSPVRVSSVCDSLCNEFEVDREVCLNDVLSILSQMKSNGLLREVEQPGVNRPLHGGIGRLLSLSALLGEATMWLIISRLAIFALPFRIIASALDRPMRRRVLTEPQRGRQRRRIQWAIHRAARFLPGKTVCFPRGIAAFAMCRGRGIDSVLHYGAAVFPGEGLKAHVWLQDGVYGITGHSVAADYCVLARFPAGAIGE